jgi:hypothetical protein
MLSRANDITVAVSIFDLCFQTALAHFATGQGPPIRHAAVSYMMIRLGRALPSR